MELFFPCALLCYDAAFHKYRTTIYPAKEFHFPPFSYFKMNVYIYILILNSYDIIPAFISAVLISVFLAQDERWGFEIPGGFSPPWQMTLCFLLWLEMKGQYNMYFAKACLIPFCLENKITGIKFPMSFSYQLVLQRFRGWLVSLLDLICFRALLITGQGSIKSCILKPGQSELCTEGETPQRSFS